MLNNDLALTMKEAVESLHSNDTGDISNLDAILNLATMMADTLANGIIKQVPSRFV